MYTVSACVLACAVTSARLTGSGMFLGVNTCTQLDYLSGCPESAAVGD